MIEGRHRSSFVCKYRKPILPNLLPDPNPERPNPGQGWKICFGPPDLDRMAGKHSHPQQLLGFKAGVAHPSIERPLHVITHQKVGVAIPVHIIDLRPLELYRDR